jgi:hypothetical protein
MASAAGAGHIAMCEHLRSIGCAWNAWNAGTCSSAAREDHINMLRWLRENGCPWDISKVSISAAHCGSTSILDYVIEQGEVLDAELLTDALICAGASDQLHAAQWLRQHDAQWPAVLSYEDFDEIKQWSGESLAWARAEGCTSPTTL